MKKSSIAGNKRRERVAQAKATQQRAAASGKARRPKKFSQSAAAQSPHPSRTSVPVPDRLPNTGIKRLFAAALSRGEKA